MPERKLVYDISLWYTPSGSRTIRTIPLSLEEATSVQEAFRRHYEPGDVVELNVDEPLLLQEGSLPSRLLFISRQHVLEMTMEVIEDAESKHKGRPHS